MVDIKNTTEEGHTLITVNGEIDASSSIELDNAIKEAANSSTRIMIDLSGLDYISSAGLGVFISYLEELKKKEARLVVFGLQENVYEVFQILGLQHLMTIKEDKKEALAYLNG